MTERVETYAVGGPVEPVKPVLLEEDDRILPVASACPCCGQSVPDGIAVRVTENAASEALIGGKPSAGDIREMLRRALRERAQQASGVEYVWVSVVDHTDTDVVYCAGDDCLWQCPYAIAGDTVTLGDPQRVVPAYVPAPATETAEGTTERDRHAGRVLESLGTDEATGARTYRVQVIAYGESKNGRRYPAKVMRSACSLYEGAKAYDHHRTEEELSTGTVAGLVGYYRNVKATGSGIEADLHLLPSATHAAEALDAALALGGTEPLVGISHDVQATFRPVLAAGRQIAEATQIVRVLSADIVSDPAAGGAAIRAVAGGIDPTTSAGTVPAGETKEPDVPVTKADLLAALKDVSGEDLAAVGLARAGTTETTKATETETTDGEHTTEAAMPKAAWLAKAMIRQKVVDAGLPEAVVEGVTAALPDRICEADVDAQIGALKAAMGVAERAGLAPTVTTQVTQESRDKKIAALDAFFAQDWAKGYRSFREAFADFTGHRQHAFDEDFNRRILRESFGGGFDSAARESLDSTSWAQVLGDSITRRLVAEYQVPSLQDWRRVVSSVIPVNDFRTQRIGRVGGYGTLPTVNQGAPYQPLTSPTDEEATYAIIKRGGTDDLTLEMIANDDVRAIVGLPALMGRAAAITLYRFVFDLFTTNAATTYDGVAWFDAGHANTTTGALSQTSLTAARVAMRSQARYGDATDLLSLVPAILVVPNELEEIAYQLTTSAVAIPATAAGPSNTPNIHNRMQEPIVVDYWTDANDWFAVADPNRCPTIEIGFYQGRQDPELFTQADQVVGSMFNADKMTLKIRHVYSGTPLDHRGVYRTTN